MDAIDKILAEMPKRRAINELVGYCEGLVASDLLGEAGEMSLRLLIAQAIIAFDLPTKVDRDAVSS